jgi:hypothetical protein
MNAINNDKNSNNNNNVAFSYGNISLASSQETATRLPQGSVPTNASHFYNRPTHSATANNRQTLTTAEPTHTATANNRQAHTTAANNNNNNNNHNIPSSTAGRPAIPDISIRLLNTPTAAKKRSVPGTDKQLRKRQRELETKIAALTSTRNTHSSVASQCTGASASSQQRSVITLFLYLYDCLFIYLFVLVSFSLIVCWQGTFIHSQVINIIYSLTSHRYHYIKNEQS